MGCWASRATEKSTDGSDSLASQHTCPLVLSVHRLCLQLDWMHRWKDGCTDNSPTMYKHPRYIKLTKRTVQHYSFTCLSPEPQFPHL